MNELWQQICHLHELWTFYCAIYAKGPEPINLLNERTGYIFGQLQFSLWERVLVAICRLLDPAVSARRDTLSIETCIRKVVGRTDRCRGDLSKALKAIRMHAGTIRQNRDKLLAHHDLRVAIDDLVVDGVSRKTIQAVIDGIEKLYSDLSLAHSNSSASFKGYPVTMEHAVEMLFDVVRLGNNAVDERRRKRRATHDRMWGPNTLPENYDPGPEYDV